MTHSSGIPIDGPGTPTQPIVATLTLNPGALFVLPDSEPDSKTLARNIAALVDRYYQTAKDEGDRAALANLASLMRHATAYIMVMSTELEEWAKAESIALDERDEWMRKYEELADENDELRRQLPDYEVTR